MKGRCIFTRSQQVVAFQAAYQTMSVSCVTLRNLGNFKGLFQTTTTKIANITKPRSFLIERDVNSNVCVRFKDHMHSAEWTGMNRGAAAQLPLFLTASSSVLYPRMRDAPDYVLKVVEERTITYIEQRYRSCHGQLAPAYVFGEWNLRSKR